MFMLRMRIVTELAVIIIGSVIVYALTLAPLLSCMSPGCKLSPSSSVSNIVLCVQALSFMTSVPYINPEL